MQQQLQQRLGRGLKLRAGNLSRTREVGSNSVRQISHYTFFPLCSQQTKHNKFLKNHAQTHHNMTWKLKMKKKTPQKPLESSQRKKDMWHRGEQQLTSLWISHQKPWTPKEGDHSEIFASKELSTRILYPVKMSFTNAHGIDIRRGVIATQPSLKEMLKEVL